MTTVVFLSRHDAAPAMMSQLTEKLGEFEFIQYRGTFSKLSGSPEYIKFHEVLDVKEGESLLNENGEELAVGRHEFDHCIPTDSIIIAVAPPQLQIEMLNAIKFSGNKATLLQPLTNRISTAGGSVTFEYAGLNQVHKVEIITTLFCSETVKPAEERR